MAQFKLSSQAQIFRAPDGQAICFPAEIGVGHPVWLSPDGVRFYETHQLGGMSGGPELRLELTLEDAQEQEYEVQRKGDGPLTVNGVPYTLDAGRASSIDYISLPTIRKPEYLFVTPDGVLIYVSCDKWHYEYESLRLYVGRPPAMQYSPMTKGVVRYRDGGTTYVSTAAGVLYAPTAFKPEAKASWTPPGGPSIPLTKLDPKQVEITEQPDRPEVEIIPGLALYTFNDYQI